MSLLFLKKLIHKDTQLRTLPTNFSYLLKALTEDTLTYPQLSKIITQYPGIAARLLFLANSAWIAPSTPIVTLEMACARLGLSMVRSVSITLCVSMPFISTQCPPFDPVRFWSSALLVADGAAWLAKCSADLSEQDVKLIHTAGLLHNIGLLWMVDSCSKKTALAFESVATDPLASTTEELRKSVGTDYCEVGEILGNAWQLPDVLVTVIVQHRNLNYQDSNSQYVAPVTYSAKMVSALYKNVIVLPELPHSHISPHHLNTVFSKLKEKADDYRELAKLLFTY